MSYETPRFDPFGASNYNDIQISYRRSGGFLLRTTPLSSEEYAELLKDFPRTDETFDELIKCQRISRETLDTMIGVSDIARRCNDLVRKSRERFETLNATRASRTRKVLDSVITF